MPSCLKTIFTCSAATKHDSVALLIGSPHEPGKPCMGLDILHIVPKTGTREPPGCGIYAEDAFRRCRVVETKREKLGSITFAEGLGDSSFFFFQELADTALEMLQKEASEGVEGTLKRVPVSIDLLERVLRTVAMDGMFERNAREPSPEVSVTYPIFVVHVERPRARELFTVKERHRFLSTFG
ncbi:hypothetical protein TI39_contig5900g00003 [Zymoseptoria brevis]|uniref:Uncharacterized protein n=1 Tax=Zymoseptoria brevis TaxID=1047168 RepID=A0A0F4G4A3_9PEZI|nr:hypothetical protein TI39_contig5900g00003 [Zymoseptoria brevis]